MSISKIYSAHCDGEDCGNWTAEEFSAREARSVARRHGFVRIPGKQYAGRDNDGRDLCPKCAAKAATPADGQAT